jgi:hypothetical protein
VETLTDFQHRMMMDLVGEQSTPLGREAYEIDAIAIHRNTIWDGLVRTLRLIFPTVRRLGGDNFFDQSATTYAHEHLPRQANLSTYGDQFPKFLAEYGPAREVPYLHDIAYFDLMLDRCANDSIDLLGAIIDIQDNVTIELTGSLRCILVNYPVHAIREILEAGGEEELRTIDMRRASRYLAIWRGKSGVTAKALSEPSGAFLSSILNGDSRLEAVASALAYGGPHVIAGALVNEIVSASFARVAIKRPQESHHG